MRLKIYRDDLKRRIPGGLTGIGMGLFGYFAISESLAAPSPELAERALWYGITLVIAGVALRHRPLRFAAMAVLVLAISKVFLYDTAHLEGCFRVVSLMGLGIALTSYAGTMGIGFNCDPDIVPDVGLFVTRFRQSIERVAAAAHVEIGPVSDDVNELSSTDV